MYINISFHGNQHIWGSRQMFWSIDMEYDLFQTENAIFFFNICMKYVGFS